MKRRASERSGPFPGNNTIIGGGYGDGMSTELTHDTLNPITCHRIADLATHRDAETTGSIRTVAVDQEKVRLMRLDPFLGQREEFSPFPETQRGRKIETDRHRLFNGNLNRQPFPPFGAATFDNKAAIFRSHPDKKTVSPLSADVTGLKCSFHGYVTSPGEYMFSLNRKGLLLTMFRLKCQGHIFERSRINGDVPILLTRFRN